MSEILKKEIPKYMHNLVVHASYYSVSRFQRSTLVLLKNLTFCEVKCGQLLREINLSETLLRNCIVPSHSSIISNEAPSGQIFEGSPHKYIGYSQQEETNKSIYFGKFITNYLGDKKFFILIHFNDKLIVLLKHDEFSIHCEYEDVESFRIVDENKSFSARVELKFLNGDNCITTDFEDDNNVKLDPSALLEDFEQNDAFKRLLTKISISNSELLVHRGITKKDFLELKNVTTFGCNKIRSCTVEEKQMLSKCGDIWWRITPSDVLVIGIPLVNNCSKRLKPLLNVRPILLLLNDGQQLEYEYSLYKLSVHYKDLTNIELFFESEDCNSSSQVDFNTDWTPLENEILEPESFGVIIIKLNVQSLLIAHMLSNFLCFIEYEVIDLNRSTNIPMQLFVKNFCFQRDLSDLEALQINFSKSTIYGDLLSLTSTTSQASFKIVFDCAEHSIVNEIQKHIIINLNFTIYTGEYENAMDVDTNETQQIFYNNNKNSFWYGSLVRTYHISNHPKTMNLKLYTKKDNILLFVRSLYENLNSKTKIFKISHLRNTEHEYSMLLKDSLKMELEKKIEYYTAMDPINISTECKIACCHNLIKAELSTDLIVKKNFKNFEEN